MPRLKAYQVSDGNDGCCIRFATNSATARREGANEIDCEWEDIDYCHRRPEFDQYAPGPVPHEVLIEHGWWWECGHCYERVNADTQQRVFGADGHPYCKPECLAAADSPTPTNSEHGEPK